MADASIQRNTTSSFKTNPHYQSYPSLLLPEECNPCSHLGVQGVFKGYAYIVQELSLISTQHKFPWITCIVAITTEHFRTLILRQSKDFTPFLPSVHKKICADFVSLKMWHCDSYPAQLLVPLHARTQRYSSYNFFFMNT